MRISHNMSAIFAGRQVKQVTGKLDKAIEKLASGEQINRAGDDASGLAVSEKMRTQIHGLEQAGKNAENGLSFIQVAEGSFQQLNDILQRVRVLAVQSANGIYSNSDRNQIQVEVSQLIDEVDRISKTAQFNGMPMLNGDFGKAGSKKMFFHVGSNRDERIPVVIEAADAKSFELKDQTGAKRNISDVAAANDMIEFVDKGLDKLNRQRANLGAYYNRLENTIRALAESYENMMAADARIRDADMADVMVEYTKNQILVQTGTAMLAQANHKPKLTMKLFD